MRRIFAIGALALAFSAAAQTRPITEADIPSVLRSLTTEQKARLVVGTEPSTTGLSHYTPGSAGWTYAIDDKGIPSLNLADGPVGPR
ncbi:MAG: glycosyl hydrolase, partial [Muribaculaceae bacterium]|nr:glycosyl hydrolase [Muribaculaceae bacterium]